MKKLICLVLVLAACRTTTKSYVAPPQPGSSTLTGAPDARGAVQLFLAASEAQDVQALASVWGTKDGAARDIMPRDTLEKRGVIMLCYLHHDKYAIISDAPAVGGMRVFAVQLTRGDLTRAANFDAVSGPSGRWYVQDFQMDALVDLCKKK